MTTSKTGNNLDDGIGQRVHDAADRLSEMKVDSLGALMKAHPWASIGVGIGVGYLLARLVHR
jgi:ElaB/YqjD/DUF883 family membrane-anchored ribosome-binding protein